MTEDRLTGDNHQIYVCSKWTLGPRTIWQKLICHLKLKKKKGGVGIWALKEEEVHMVMQMQIFDKGVFAGPP